MLKINTCKHLKCWQPTKHGKYFCQLHWKVNQDIMIEFFMKVYAKLGKEWNNLITIVRKKAEPQNQNEIKISVLLEIFGKYDIKFTDAEKERMLDSYPGWDEG